MYHLDRHNIRLPIQKSLRDGKKAYLLLPENVKDLGIDQNVSQSKKTICFVND